MTKGHDNTSGIKDSGEDTDTGGVSGGNEF